METERSKLYRLVERDLGESLADLIAARRTYDYPWAAIAREISARSEIEISDDTLRRWFPDDEAAASESERSAA
jgi:hypothetical protein